MSAPVGRDAARGARVAGMRVLVIEDEPQLAATITQALREAGLGADAARDGDTGLQLALEESVDAVVLDLLLPRRHGLSVLQEIRKRRPELPVLILTALGGVEDRVGGLDRGADDYLAKPFALTELLARVRAMLRRGGARFPSACVTVGDLEVDLAAHTAHRGGRRLDLTPREYALLTLFLGRRGEALSRAEIGERVVIRGFEATSNLIDVSVCGLRRKLGDPPLIHTVRGHGYRLDAPGGGDGAR